MSTTPDGFVVGNISSDSTSAKVIANVSCSNGVPTGKIFGVVETFTGKGITKYVFRSTNPYIVATIKNPSGVYSIFNKVTLVNANTGFKIKDCTVVLNSYYHTSTTWVGSFTVICPTGKKLGVFGKFSGSLKVNRAVVCTPLL